MALVKNERETVKFWMGLVAAGLPQGMPYKEFKAARDAGNAYEGEDVPELEVPAEHAAVGREGARMIRRAIVPLPDGKGIFIINKVGRSTTASGFTVTEDGIKSVAGAKYRKLALSAGCVKLAVEAASDDDGEDDDSDGEES